MVKKFIVLTTQRSGSNYFCFWLNNHPNVRCHSELFLRKYVGADGFERYSKTNPVRYFLYNIFGNKFANKIPFNQVITNLIKDYYHSLIHNPVHSGPLTDTEDLSLRAEYHTRDSGKNDKAVGFKLMYDQLEDFKCLKELIKNEGVLIIHLIRTNLLKMHLSKLTRRKRGVAHSSKKVEKVKVGVNHKTILNQLDELNDDQQRMKKMFPGNPYLEVTFEDIFYRQTEIARKVCDFLGVEQCKIRPPVLKKLNPDSVRDIVENYDEVSKKLIGTRYEHFLD